MTSRFNGSPCTSCHNTSDVFDTTQVAAHQHHQHQHQHQQEQHQQRGRRRPPETQGRHPVSSIQRDTPVTMKGSNVRVTSVFRKKTKAKDIITEHYY